MTLHCAQALATNETGCVIMRSHSGDADINIVSTVLILEDAHCVFIDFNTGRNHKILCLGNIDLSDLEKMALIGVLAYFGNDYASSFFRKSKWACWNAVLKRSQFVNTFADLGKNWSPSQKMLQELENFVTFL